jgi:cytochrome P450
MAQITFQDFLAQETKRDPYSFCNKLREQGPLIPIDDFYRMGKGWIITNYDDALAILKDPRFIKDARKILAFQETTIAKVDSPLASLTTWRKDMLTSDPPDHTRLRNLVSKAFTPRMIEQLRPRIQQIADELLDAVQDQGKMELIEQFAFPLPITVISEMLGIPASDRQRFRRWTQAITNAESPQANDGGKTTTEEFLSYIKQMLVEKRKHPGEDLISEMLQAEENGDILSEMELVSTILLLIVAGHETTSNLIGTGTLVLLQHPEQIRLLQDDPSLIASAIEELLRYTAPVSLTSFRWANEDVLFHDQLIHKGELVQLSLIGANMDTQQFSDPETLDITRQVNKHLTFGKGIHVCLGAPLARLEGQIAFGTLLRRFPNLRLACKPEQLHWNVHPILRGLTSLPVAF